MNTKKHYIALMELLLVMPAALFMASLVVRQLPASGFDATAQRAVMWYAERPWTLWLLLVTLPLVVLVVGCTTLLQTWETGGRNPVATISARGATISIAVLTCAAGIILGIVGLHILAN